MFYYFQSDSTPVSRLYHSSLLACANFLYLLYKGGVGQRGEQLPVSVCHQISLRTALTQNTVSRANLVPQYLAL